LVSAFPGSTIYQHTDPDRVPHDVLHNPVDAVFLTADGKQANGLELIPLLRSSRGRVVLMGSIGGRSALPFLGAYAMSKFALEAMTDSLRVELEPWGIHVSIVEPGTIKTPIWTRERPDPPPEALSLYGTRMDAFRKLAVARGSGGAPPELVADAVEHALAAEKPRTRYLVGRDAKLRARVERLPDRLRDRVIVRRVLGA
jgi:NAD(P)-dependent dehydrogenase (short-subunit alcohol dehydrogenase family)